MRRRATAQLVLLAVLSAVAAAGCSRGSGSADTSVLSTWYEQTDAAVAAQGPPPDPVAARTWALAWWAADRAVAGRNDGPFVDAAVASAVHDVLVELVPKRKAALDDALDHGADKAGSASGRKQAAAVLAQRSNDGLDSREAMQAARLSTAEGARLLSAFHRITADAEIAVFDAKYTHLSWRPITALQVDDDSDPSTPRIRNWNPLIRTPGHPEYPSAHTAYAAAAAAVLAHFLGPAPARPLAMADATAKDTRRTSTTWQQAVDENEDARVWAGIHFRNSDEVGSQLGRRVAAFELSHM